MDDSPLLPAAPRTLLARAQSLDARLNSLPGVNPTARALDKTLTTTGQVIAFPLLTGPAHLAKGLLTLNHTLFSIPGLRHLSDATAKIFDWQWLDKKWARAMSPKITSARQAAEAWLAKPEGAAPVIKGLIDQTVPTALVPREWLALKYDMDRKAAFGTEQSNDLIRALSQKDKPRVSDIAYPPQFIADPKYRVQLFDAMEGRIAMSSLPPEMQQLGTKLRAMLRETGLELVRQGLMHPDTFEELQENGWMPRYTEDDAKAQGGSFLTAFKLGIQDIRQQRSTAFHIVDTSRRDRTGQHPTVNRTEKGGRNAWRFRDAASRDAFYSDFIRQQALEMLKGTHGNTKEIQSMMATLDGQQRREVRAQIQMLTRADMDTPAKLSQALGGMVKQAIEHQKSKYKKENPFDPRNLIKDPVYAIARYVLAQTHNAATMELLKATAANPDWSSPVALQGFTAIPDTSRFGPLAGKYIREDIARQVLDLVTVPNAALKFYDSTMRVWKAGKLVWNPASHCRDAIGNSMFSYLAGNTIWNRANWPHYQNALKLLRGETLPNGLTYADLIKHGVLGGDAYSSLVKDRLKGLLPDARTVEDFNPGLIQRSFMGLAEKARAAHNKVSEWRRLPDDFYKTAAFLQQIAQTTTDGTGLPTPSALNTAAEHVLKWFPYYDRLGNSVFTRGYGRIASPFFSFFRESTRIFLQGLAERPVATAAAISFPIAITTISAIMLGLSDRDREEIDKDLNGRGNSLFGLGNLHLFSMLLPVPSAQGTVQQFDISAIMPFADLLGQKVVPLEDKENALQTFIRSRMTAGPWGGLLYSVITNRDAFSGRHIVESDMSTPEQLRAQLGHLSGVMLPPLAPDAAHLMLGLGEGGPLSKAGQRQTNKTLQTYDTTQTVLRALFGLNVKSAAPNLYRQAEDFRKAHGYDAQPDFDYGTTVTSRVKRALVQQLAQDTPNPTALQNLKARLHALGVPLETAKDISKVLKIIDPAQVIGGSKKAGLTAEDARQKFRQSLPPESRGLYEASLREYQRILLRAPMLLRSAK